MDKSNSGRLEIEATVIETGPTLTLNTRDGESVKEYVLLEYLTHSGKQNRMSVSCWNGRSGKLKVGDKIYARINIQAHKGQKYWLNDIVLFQFEKL